MNALHHACNESNLKIVEILVQKISDINARTKKKQTALHLAILAGSFDITKYLIENGANFEILDINKNTVLHMACISGHIELAKYLLDLFPYPEYRNLEHQTASELTNNEKIITAMNNVIMSNKINCNKMSANKDKNNNMTNLFAHNFGLKKASKPATKINIKIGGSNTNVNSYNNLNNIDFANTTRDDRNKPKFINMNHTVDMKRIVDQIAEATPMTDRKEQNSKLDTKPIINKMLPKSSTPKHKEQDVNKNKSNTKEEIKNLYIFLFNKFN